MDQNELPLEPCRLGVQSGASKTIFEPIVCLAQTMHLSCAEINILQMDQNELPLDPRHLGVSLGASKTTFEPMVHWMQTEHLSCAEINIVSKWTENELPLDQHHLEVPWGAQNDFRANGMFGANRAPILHRD
jgi:hypothetical protein